MEDKDKKLDDICRTLYNAPYSDGANIRQQCMCQEILQLFNPEGQQATTVDVEQRDIDYDEDMINAFNAGREGFGGALKQRVYTHKSPYEWLENYKRSINNKES